MELSDVYQKFKTPAFLTCPVCLETFTDPRLLPCSHTVCLECISGIMANSGRSVIDQQQHVTIFCCPMCRSAVTVTASRNLPVNRALEDIIEDWKSRIKTERCQWLRSLIKTCSVHKQDADVWCHSCNLNICSSCTLPIASNSSNDSPDTHAHHEFESIPNLQRYCEHEANRIDEWIMVLPTVHEMFDVMKMLGTEETQLHKIQDKFLADLNKLEGEINSVLSMKASAVVTDMSKRLTKLVDHIQSRREILCTALSELVGKFESLGYANSPSEIATTEFKISIMNCKQLSKENAQLHESDVKEMVSDHRRLIAMCMKKMERFRQSVLDVDFQARSLVTLLRQLSDTSAENTSNRRTPPPGPTVPRFQQRNPNANGNLRGAARFSQNPTHQQTPRTTAPAFGPPTFIVPQIPMITSAGGPGHLGPRFCGHCSQPFLAPATAHTQTVPSLAHQPIRFQPPAFPLNTPSPLMVFSNPFAAPNAVGQAQSQGAQTQAGNSQQVVNPTMFVVPGPGVQVVNRSRPTLIWSLNSRTQESNETPTSMIVSTEQDNHSAPPENHASLNSHNITQSNATELQDVMTQGNTENVMDYTEEGEPTNDDRRYTPSPVDISPAVVPSDMLVSNYVPDHEESYEVSPTGSEIFGTSSEESLPRPDEN